MLLFVCCCCCWFFGCASVCVCLSVSVCCCCRCCCCRRCLCYLHLCPGFSCCRSCRRCSNSVVLSRCSPCGSSLTQFVAIISETDAQLGLIWARNMRFPFSRCQTRPEIVIAIAARRGGKQTHTRLAEYTAIMCRNNDLWQQIHVQITKCYNFTNVASANGSAKRTTKNSVATVRLWMRTPEKGETSWQRCRDSWQGWLRWLATRSSSSAATGT